MLLRLDWIENTALLLDPNRERLAQVEDKPAIRRDVAAIRRVCGACFLHRHSTSSDYGREPTRRAEVAYDQRQIERLARGYTEAQCQIMPSRRSPCRRGTAGRVHRARR